MKKRKRIRITILLLVLCAFMAACTSAEDYPDTPDMATETPDAPPESPAPTPEPEPPQSPEEFLIQFPTLFSFSWERDGGELYNFDTAWDGIGSPWFDSQENRIDPPDFLWVSEWGDSFVPLRYHLYDLTDDEMPIILILWGIPQTSEAVYIVYRSTDRVYQEVGRLWLVAQFFRDDAGRIVVLNDEPSYFMVMNYDYITFNDTGMTVAPIIDAPLDENWNWQGHFHNYTTGEQSPFVGGDDWLVPCEAWESHHADGPPRTIFGMPNETITPIVPLTDLQERINAEVRARLGL
ncbi:MAG: hypothetical protein FWE08_06305 [Oscillospiraceae bacterium]|nr:hypothetical protein [Oscillospiraceae bacterium]